MGFLGKSGPGKIHEVILVVYQLPVEMRTLCQWPLKCRAQTHLPRGLRFPVPQDKGNDGSGDEIVEFVKLKPFQRDRLIICVQ